MRTISSRVRLGDDEDYGKLGPELPGDSADVKEFSKTEELKGSPGKDPEKQGLMNTVLDGDKRSIDIGGMVMHSMDSGVNFFTPELVMEKLLRDYRSAKEIFGEVLIRQLTGYDTDYVEKNIRIPEFERMIHERVKQNIAGLKKEGLADDEGAVTDEAVELATVVLAVQELDHLTAEGVIGERVHKRRSNAGIHEETKRYDRDPYSGINVAQSVKVALRRKHKKLAVDDLRAFEREAKGSSEVVYAIDSSGSMKGEKLAQAKRAGIALSYKAVNDGDKVGLLVFGKDVEHELMPCRDFSSLLRIIAGIRAGRGETDIAASIKEAVGLFKARDGAKHLIMLTDVLPTVGENPDEDVLGAAAEARAAGITISVIGVALDKHGEELAERIVDIARGRLLLVKDLEGLDVLVIEEYLNSKA